MMKNITFLTFALCLSVLSASANQSLGDALEDVGESIENAASSLVDAVKGGAYIAGAKAAKHAQAADYDAYMAKYDSLSGWKKFTHFFDKLSASSLNSNIMSLADNIIEHASSDNPITEDLEKDMDKLSEMRKQFEKDYGHVELGQNYMGVPKQVYQ